jgi:CRISPR/Cas system-associated protein Csx1
MQKQTGDLISLLSYLEAEHNTDQQCVSWMQSVPEIVLEKIMHNLSYQEVYRLSTLCRRFRLDAATVIRLAFRKLVPRIEKEIKEIKETVKPRNNSSARAITDEEFKYLALSDRPLRILISDARLLKAICWRYVRDDRAKEFCLPCGVVLDTFSCCCSESGNDQSPQHRK